MKGTTQTTKVVPIQNSSIFPDLNVYIKNISPSERFHPIMKSLEPDEDITVS